MVKSVKQIAGLRAVEVSRKLIRSGDIVMATTVSSVVDSCAFSKVEPRPLSEAASSHLDLFRAIAAWAVMWGHLRSIFFVDFQHLFRGSRALDALYFVTGFGHQAVMVFFVLSGFLISSAILKREASRDWSWRDYAIDRSSRLYAVLIPGLLVGLLLDEAGSRLFVSSGLYSHPLVSFGSVIPQNQITLRIFLGNLFFLQTILCPTFGSNGPLWSLANEFWYYVLFPLGLFAGLAWAKHSFRRAISLTILALCAAAFVGWGILLGFVIWLAGSVLVLAYSRLRLETRISFITYLGVSFLALCLCLVAARTGKFAVLGGDLSVGFAFTLFLFGILQMDFENPHIYCKGASHFFAGFSYSLYVIHFPCLLFLKAWIAPSQRWQPNAVHLCYGAVIGAVVLSFAWLVSLFTEKKTRVARNWMRGMMPRFDAASRTK
jgi:peptidoglycan/LPS O-acetylase OafA/YrhL